MWLEATSSYGALRLSDSVLVVSQLHGAATGGIGDSFVLLPRVLWCGVPLLGAVGNFSYLFGEQLKLVI